jgi:hypothetical protein
VRGLGQSARTLAATLLAALPAVAASGAQTLLLPPKTPSPAVVGILLGEGVPAPAALTTGMPTVVAGCRNAPGKFSPAAAADVLLLGGVVV